MHPLSYIDLVRQLRLKLPQIKTIDLFNGQYDDPERHNAFTCPAVFIEWLPVDWTDAPAGVQQGAGGFRIHCVVNTLRDSRNIDRLIDPLNPQPGIDDALDKLKHYLFPAAVHSALQGFSPYGYGSLSRTRSLPDHRYTGNIIIVHEYTAPLVDDSAFAYQDYLLHPIEDFEVPGDILL